jgi:hypothetical protein
MVKRIENLFLLWDAAKYFLLIFFVLILPTLGGKGGQLTILY